MSSVQNIAPFGAGPVVLPSTLEVVGAATADSTLEVKGATTLDTTLLVKGTSSLDNGAITTSGSGSVTLPTTGSVTAATFNIRNGGAGGTPFTVNTGGAGNWLFGWTNVGTARLVTWPDYGLTSVVNPIVSNSSGGQSLSGGLTADALTLTSTLQFSIGAGQLESIAFTISTSELSTLSSIGKTILAAPGAGNLIVPTHFVMEYVYDGAHGISGGGGGSIVLCYNANTINQASVGIADTLISGAGSSQVAVPPMNFVNVGVNFNLSTATVNQALWIRKTNADFTMNGSTATARCRLWYITHTGL